MIRALLVSCICLAALMGCDSSAPANQNPDNWRDCGNGVYQVDAMPFEWGHKLSAFRLMHPMNRIVVVVPDNHNDTLIVISEKQ